MSGRQDTILRHYGKSKGESMTKLQIEFENTGYTSWINSDIYPDGKIYTQEYTRWLEKELLASRESKFAVPSEESLNVNFHNGHYPKDNGAKFALCEYCGMAQNYWDKFKCSRIETIKRGISE